jgi:hypothetical protein
MSVLVARTPEGVQLLVVARLREACDAFGVQFMPQLSMQMGGSAHFDSPRGYATTTVYGEGRFHLKIAERFLEAELDVQDALVRHELGHIVDFSSDAEQLDVWARARGVELASTRELRADGIAEAIWGGRIFYNDADVQTLYGGTAPRPARLGL